ncbi:hypothetical protein GPECTOR_6g606 [Gonium pectorale]|uniref:F-box domain-containing protein n=1 Tax=Gonium pectorale TaxID=33097 RepID=A0A150GV23_GONPE|nr:hypothetical protein GPECTOR_6g606 [Gonium pectorale]|eukprot:KXZ53689.1 hypothetical protein GPECTOR_6g606 [Gonium pectorale]
MPPASPGPLSFAGFAGSLPRIGLLASMGPSSASGRSPKGASPRGSDDEGPDGTSDGDDDDDDMLQLEDEEGGEEGGGDSSAGDSDGAGRRALLAPGLLASGGGGRAAAAAAPEAAPLPQLPEECWMSMLQQLGVRDVCMVGRTCRWLRGLSADLAVWRSQYGALFGVAPEPGLGAAVLRRMCRRSQLRAARWLEASAVGSAMGFASSTCLQMDDSKVVSADGNAVRLWSHATGRRIATLQGHPGRVTCVAFDDSLLVSGCAGSVVKLWSMDELRCRRTLRGHDGAVTSCCLLPTGIPVSGSEDGLMRLWDVASGASIVALEAGHPVLAMQAHAASGHLVAAAGWGLQLWDVGTATLLHTLGLDDDHAAAVAAGGAAAAAVQHPYTCVSYMGELLAAGRQGEVVLLDPRVNGVVGRLRGGDGGRGARSGGGAATASLPGAIAAAAGGPALGAGGMVGNGGAFANGLGSIAAAAAAAAGTGGGGGKGAPCVGVQMDEWKLVCGFNDGRHQLKVYDIRAVPRGQAGGGAAVAPWRPWHEPLMTLTAPSRVNAFQFHEQALLAGLEGHECVMWRFENPHHLAAAAAGRPLAGSTRGAAAAVVAAVGGGVGGSVGFARTSGQGYVSSAAAAAGVAGADGGAWDGGGGSARKEKKKPAKVAKKQTRYPKRNTK